MAKKNKRLKVKPHHNQNLTRNRGPHSWEQLSASQALMAARGFKPFDFLVRRCEELSELVVEINSNAQIALESRQKLLSQARLILSGNVISKKAAQGKSDVAWVQASWAHPEGSGILDPVSTFEVGVAVARNLRPREECEKAARFLSFKEDLPGGLSMIPDSNGAHVNVPMLGILLKPNLVEVRRAGKVVGTASIWHSLIGFEERDRARFSQLTREEQQEAAAARREKAAREKEREREEREARAELEKLEAVQDCFEEIWNEWETEQEELEAAKRSELWKEFVEGADDLRELWGECVRASNNAYEADKEVIEALQLVLRPVPPKKKDLKKALPCIRNYLLGLSSEHAKFRWGKVMTWVKDFSSREGLTIGQSLTKANTDLPWLLPHWFVSEQGSVSPLYPLKGLRSYQREEWISRVAVDPIVSDEVKEKLFSLAGEE